MWSSCTKKESADGKVWSRLSTEFKRILARQSGIELWKLCSAQDCARA